MELAVGPADFGDRYVATVNADFGVPAARTPVGTIPPDGRLACVLAIRRVNGTAAVTDTTAAFFSLSSDAGVAE